MPASTSPPSALGRSPWPHRLAVITATATLPLIFVGGLVTNTGSALAVPDWPTTFGYNMFTYPWSQMVGGIFYEHSHRLIGSAVGLLTVSFVLSVWLAEPRRWVRRLAGVALSAVIVQGILGGLRVVLLEHGLAIIHGCLAQAFFALMVSLAVCTSSWWLDAVPLHPKDAGRLRILAIAAVGVLYLQMVFGALLTHVGWRIDAHLIGAASVTVALGLLVGRVLREYAEEAKLRRPAVLAVVLLSLQLSLGLGAYVWRFTELRTLMPTAVGLGFETVHRLNGAALWGTSIMLALRLLRVVGLSRTAPAATAANEVLVGRVLA